MESRIWIASNQGLFHIEPSIEWASIKKVHNAAVHSMVQDQENVLWIMSDKNIFQYTAVEGKVTKVDIDKELSPDFHLGKKIAVDHTGLIWLTGKQPRIALISKPVSFLTEVISSDVPYHLPHLDTWSIYTESEYVYSSSENTIVLLNRKTKTHKKIPIIGLSTSEDVYGIKPLDPNNLLLLTTDGLFVLDKKSQTTKAFSSWSGGARTSSKSYCV